MLQISQILIQKPSQMILRLPAPLEYLNHTLPAFVLANITYYVPGKDRTYLFFI